MKLIYSLLFLTCCSILAQEKWTSSSGSIHFEASVPVFEEISAQNNAVKCVLNSEKKTIVCVLKIKDFEFQRDLMRAHFNDIYLESNTHPRASFKGSIPNFELDKITAEGSVFKINGTIKIHGVSKKMSLNGVFKKMNNQIRLEANFVLDTDDFKIRIPSMILPKISKKVQTQLVCTLQNN